MGLRHSGSEVESGLMSGVGVRYDSKLDRPVDDSSPCNIVTEDLRTQAAVDDDLLVANVDDCGVSGAHVEKVSLESRASRGDDRRERLATNPSTPLVRRTLCQFGTDVMRSAV